MNPYCNTILVACPFFQPCQIAIYALPMLLLFLKSKLCNSNKNFLMLERKPPLPKAVTAQQWHSIIQQAMATSSIEERDARNAEHAHSKQELASLFEIAIKNKEDEYMRLLSSLIARSNNQATILEWVENYGHSHPYYVAIILAASKKFDAKQTSIENFTITHLKQDCQNTQRKYLLHSMLCVMDHWEKKEVLLELLTNEAITHSEHAPIIVRVAQAFCEKFCINITGRACQEWIGFLLSLFSSLINAPTSREAMNSWAKCMESLLTTKAFSLQSFKIPIISESSPYFRAALQALASLILTNAEYARPASKVLLCIMGEFDIAYMLEPLCEKIFMYAILDEPNDDNEIFFDLLSVLICDYEEKMPLLSSKVQKIYENPQTCSEFKLVCSIIGKIPRYNNDERIELFLTRCLSEEFVNVPMSCVIRTLAKTFNNYTWLERISSSLVSKFLNYSIDEMQKPLPANIRNDIL